MTLALQEEKGNFYRKVDDYVQEIRPLENCMHRCGEIDDSILRDNGMDSLSISRITHELVQGVEQKSGMRTPVTPSWLRKLKDQYGDRVHQEVKRCYDEIQEYNPSGGYLVQKPWNKKENRQMTSTEILELMANHSRNLQKEIDMLKGHASKKKPAGGRR